MESPRGPQGPRPRLARPALALAIHHLAADRQLRGGPLRNQGRAWTQQRGCRRAILGVPRRLRRIGALLGPADRPSRPQADHVRVGGPFCGGAPPLSVDDPRRRGGCCASGDCGSGISRSVHPRPPTRGAAVRAERSRFGDGPVRNGAVRLSQRLIGAHRLAHGNDGVARRLHPRRGAVGGEPASDLLPGALRS